MPLCMAEPAKKKEQLVPPKQQYDTNGFRVLVNGMTSDSGAGDTVGPEDAFPEYPLVPSPGSIRGLHYVAANNQKMKNMGQKRVLMMTREGQLRWVTVQIVAVKKTLASVSRSNDNGYDVIYSKKSSHMMEISSGKKTQLRRERGVFVLDCWIVPYNIAMSGRVNYVTLDGQRKSVNVGTANTEGFSRQAR